MTIEPKDVISKRITRDVPKRWATDALSDYLETAEQNTIATFANGSKVYARFSEIDASFRTLVDGLINTPNWFESFFLLRAHSAFLTSVRLAMSGAVTESYATCRQAIEFALYGYYLFKNPNLHEIWLNRTDSNESRKLVKKKFRIVEMLDRAAADIPCHGQVARQLYELTIDFGAHPNESSITTTVQVIKKGDTRLLRSIYLHDGDAPMQAALKSVAQTGVCVFGIFQKVYPERYDLLGLRDKLNQLTIGL